MRDDPLPQAQAWMSRLVVAFGATVMVHWFVASFHQIGATLFDLGFAVALFAATLACGRSVRRGDRRALPVVFVLALAGLFFVSPIAGTILLGGGAEPIGTGWDLVFFPLVAMISVAILTLLPATWRALGHARHAPPARGADVGGAGRAPGQGS